MPDTVEGFPPVTTVSGPVPPGDTVTCTLTDDRCVTRKRRRISMNTSITTRQVWTAPPGDVAELFASVDR
jgi:hypothetical protein